MSIKIIYARDNEIQKSRKTNKFMDNIVDNFE